MKTRAGASDDVITAGHGTITMLIDQGRGRLIVWSEPEPHRADWREARRTIGGLTDGIMRECYSDGPADVFEFFLLPACRPCHNDGNELSSVHGRDG